MRSGAAGFLMGLNWDLDRAGDTGEGPWRGCLGRKGP